MKSKADSIATIICFVAVIFLLSLCNILLSGKNIRKDAIPQFSFDSLLEGEYLSELEDLYNNTFIAGNIRGKIKTGFSTHVLGIRDIDGYYITGGGIVEMEHKLYGASVKNAAGKLNEIYNKYLRGHDVYYCIIPDKNLVTAPVAGRLAFDYKKMLEILGNEISSPYKRIDIVDLLEPGDYYNTDLHWKQERIIDVSDKLLTEMGCSAKASDYAYNENKLYPFYGPNYNTAWLGLRPDTLIYLTNDLIENAEVYDYETEYNNPVYDLKGLEGENPYNAFLHGSKPLLTVTNRENTSGRELILFRDSFASSIAPLLLAGYSSITLVDLRYIASDLLEEYIDFGRGQDVCFLYSTLVINNSFMLK